MTVSPFVKFRTVPGDLMIISRTKVRIKLGTHLTMKVAPGLQKCLCARFPPLSQSVVHDFECHESRGVSVDTLTFSDNMLHKISDTYYMITFVDFFADPIILFKIKLCIYFPTTPLSFHFHDARFFSADQFLLFFGPMTVLPV